MDQPFVSVIIPAYNGEVFLAEAIRSIQQQNYNPLEIIIVDDGSTDGTAQVATNFKDQVRYVYQPNSGGPAAGRNRGIKMARGELICFLDQDDLWLPQKLEVQIRFLRKNPEVGYLFAKQELFFEKSACLPEAVRKVWEKEKIFQEAHDGYLPGTFLVRRAVFERVGPFNEGLINTSDLDWFFRAKDMGIKSGVVPKVLLYKRFHSENSCYQVNITRKEIFGVIRDSIHRRNKKG